MHLCRQINPTIRSTKHWNDDVDIKETINECSQTYNLSADKFIIKPKKPPMQTKGQYIHYVLIELFVKKVKECNKTKPKLI